MVLYKKSNELQFHVGKLKAKGMSVGFVPTMGALHRGHLSLIEASKKINDLTVCSIFVNPTQFNDAADYNKYPITLERDIQMLQKVVADVLFVPGVDEIYGSTIDDIEKYDLGYLETMLEGKHRPGHFQGVCQVMSRLLKIVTPNHLFMGQKDYQQCMVIKRLIEIMHLEKEIKLITCPTVRETDGLAMSSRNLRLTGDARKKAALIFTALKFVKDHLSSESLLYLKQTACLMLKQQGFKVEYFEIAQAATLEIPNEWDGRQALVAMVAAYIGEVRLIDNFLL